jgi:hypothetical protein
MCGFAMAVSAVENGVTMKRICDRKMTGDGARRALPDAGQRSLKHWRRQTRSTQGTQIMSAYASFQGRVFLGKRDESGLPIAR